MDVKKGDKIMSKLPISIYSLDKIDFGDSAPLGIGEHDKFYGIEVHSGLFKTCLVSASATYVIKYGTSNNKDIERDYKIYQEAKKYGVDKIFLPLEFLYQNVHGVKFFIQPKFVDTVQSGNSSCPSECPNQNYDCDLCCFNISPSHARAILKNRSSKINKKRLENAFGNFYDSVDSEWFARAAEFYGFSFIYKLNKFLCENDVSDLHEGNIGYMTNERPVLIDYGGV